MFDIQKFINRYLDESTGSGLGPGIPASDFVDPSSDTQDSNNASVESSDPIEEIIKYIMHTPENTNPNILRQMLRNIGGNIGGNIGCKTTVTNNTDETLLLDNHGIFKNNSILSSPASELDPHSTTSFQLLKIYDDNNNLYATVLNIYSSIEVIYQIDPSEIWTTAEGDDGNFSIFYIGEGTHPSELTVIINPSSSENPGVINPLNPGDAAESP